MKGKISKSVIGAFNNVKKYGRMKFTFSISLKKLISSSKFNIKINDKNINDIFINFFKNFFTINC